MGAPKNLGVHPFPDPASHFGFLRVLIDGMIKLKNLFTKSCSGGQITKGLTFFQTLLALLD